MLIVKIVCHDDGGDDLPDDLSGKVATVYLLQPPMNFCSLGHHFNELTCISVIGQLRIYNCNVCHITVHINLYYIRMSIQIS